MMIPIRENHLRPIFPSSPSEAAVLGATGLGATTAPRCKGAVGGACTRAEIFAGEGCAAAPIPMPGSAADAGETIGGRGGGGGGGATVGAGGLGASCGGAIGAAGAAAGLG